MATTTGGPWICTECGKVCKSRGGLTQHSSSHKRHPCLGELRGNSYRIYHAKLDGMPSFSSSLTSSNPLKGNHVAEMGSFFPLEHHQLPHPQSLPTIGLHLYRVLDSNLPRFCIQRQQFQTTISTDSLTSGLLHWSPTTILHQYLTTTTFMQQSMQSNSAMYPGNHTPPTIEVSAQTTHPHPSGWTPSISSGIVILERSFITSLRTPVWLTILIMFPTVSLRTKNDGTVILCQATGPGGNV